MCCKGLLCWGMAMTRCPTYQSKQIFKNLTNHFFLALSDFHRLPLSYFSRQQGSLEFEEKKASSYCIRYFSARLILSYSEARKYCIVITWCTWVFFGFFSLVWKMQREKSSIINHISVFAEIWTQIPPGAFEILWPPASLLALLA